VILYPFLKISNSQTENISFTRILIKDFFVKQTNACWGIRSCWRAEKYLVDRLVDEEWRWCASVVSLIIPALCVVLLYLSGKQSPLSACNNVTHQCQLHHRHARHATRQLTPHQLTLRDCLKSMRSEIRDCVLGAPINANVDERSPIGFHCLWRPAWDFCRCTNERSILKTWRRSLGRLIGLIEIRRPSRLRSAPNAIRPVNLIPLHEMCLWLKFCTGPSRVSQRST